MEFFSILLASLFSALSPVGWIVDQRIETAFRSRLTDVETLQVRVDNTPNYQLLQGKIQRLRLAARGVNLTPELRLKSFALETDPIALDINRFREGNFSSLSEARSGLNQPLNVALKLNLTEADINDFLASPRAKARLESIIQRITQQLPGGRNQRYELLSTKLQFLENDRFILDLDIRVSRRQREEWEDFNLRVESGIEVSQGKQLRLINPVFLVDDSPLPSRLVEAVSARLSNRLDLSNLEKQKIIARLLQLKIEEDEVKLAAFVQIAKLP
ncbi:LmeA family phospholipid-binding protein [Dactylococcopsis salina]|uniref:DUF2993 domain-containing protein n=1 Tax=Dactylococcopsis salina (strain PCC 8305) TaxID=13035 RepID=K9YV48_DACS8|nr:DUF2993 domain-containing protein [Dactylococcopsis salina]AFZ50397.1 Protein of unknown function (DUF2993) [Dactylococcopsis salina PCC 8305]